MRPAVLAAVKAGGATARPAPPASMASKFLLLARCSTPTLSSSFAASAAAAAAAGATARSAPRVLGLGQAIAAGGAAAPAVFSPSSPSSALRRFFSSGKASGSGPASTPPKSSSSSSSSSKLPESLSAASAAAAALARSAASRLPPLPPGLGGTSPEQAASSSLRRFASNIAGPTLFASVGAASCCLAAATYQLQERDRNRNRITKTVIGAILGLELAKESERPPKFAEAWPAPLRSLATRARNSWNGATATERAVWGVTAVNVAVFFLWHLPLGPLWRRLMALNFVQRLPPGPPPIPHTLLTANFSHSSFWHLLANSVTLLSIGELAARSMDSEWEFWAFFGAAGCASSLASHLGRLATVSAAAKSLSSRVAAALASSSSPAAAGGGSLGASGSLYACVALAALNDPDTRVAIPLLESLGNLSIGDAFLAILSLDVIGVLRGWRRLDHWGHLGGAAAGAAWAKGGAEIWQGSLREAERLRARVRESREEARRRRREVAREQQRRRS